MTEGDDLDSDKVYEPSSRPSKPKATKRDQSVGDSDRRAFFRQFTGNATSTSDTLPVPSRLRRSLQAAGEMAHELTIPTKHEEPDGEAPGTRTDSESQSVPGSDLAPPPIPLPSERALTRNDEPRAPDPVRLLTPDQRAFLAGDRYATLAVNDVAGSPYLSMSRYLWDGTEFHLPAGLFTARAAKVGSDSRVSLLIDGGRGSWVSVIGIATVVHGEAVKGVLRAILAKHTPEDEIVDELEVLLDHGDRVIIAVAPVRFVWLPAVR